MADRTPKSQPSRPRPSAADTLDLEADVRAGGAMRALLEEQKRLKRKRRRTQIIAGLTIFVVLLYLAMTTFIFNPLEGSALAFPNLVPRNCDFFVRKTNLADDLPLPATVFTPGHDDATVWAALQEGRLGIPASAVKNATDAWAELQKSVQGAPIDLVRDVIGKELCIAGRFAEKGGLAKSQIGIYARVSWRIRAATGLAKYAYFREKIFGSAGSAEMREGGILKISQGGRDWYLWRSNDLLLIASDEAWIKEAGQLVLDKGEGSFGQGASYSDDIQLLLRDRMGDRTSPPSHLQLYCNVQNYRRASSAAKPWPDPASPLFDERAIASVFRTDIVHEATGIVRFEREPRRRIVFDLSFRTDTNNLDEFGKRLHQERSARKLSKKDVILAGELTPQSAFAVAAGTVSGGDIARQVESLLTAEDRRMLDDGVRKTVKYQSLRAFMDDVGIALGSRVIAIFRENNYPAEDKDPKKSSRPDPAVAFVFPQQSGDKVKQLKEFLLANSSQLEITQTYNYFVDAAKQYPMLEYYSAALSTGELAIMQVGGDEKGEVVITNQAKLAKNIFRTWLDPGQSQGDGRYSEDPLYRDLQSEWLERKGTVYSHFFAFVNGPQIHKQLKQFVPFWADEGSALDPEKNRLDRPALFAKILKEKYPQYNAQSVPAKERDEVDSLVDAEFQKRELQAKANISPQLLKKIESNISWIAAVPGVFMSLDLDAKRAKFYLNIAAE